MGSKGSNGGGIRTSERSGSERESREGRWSNAESLLRELLPLPRRKSFRWKERGLGIEPLRRREDGRGVTVSPPSLAASSMESLLGSRASLSSATLAGTVDTAERKGNFELREESKRHTVRGK